MSFDDTDCLLNGPSSRIDMTSSNNKTFETKPPTKSSKRTVAEKMAVAERLRDLQRALAPIRAANKAKRATSKVEIRIKTR